MLSRRNVSPLTGDHGKAVRSACQNYFYEHCFMFAYVIGIALNWVYWSVDWFRHGLGLNEL